jgi:hypothetical protein
MAITFYRFRLGERISMPGKPVYLEPMANEFYAIQGDRRYFIAITYQHGLACILKEDKILSIGQNAGGHGSGCTTEQLNIGILQNRAMPHFSTCEELPLVDIMISDDIWHLDVMRIGLNQGRVWQRFYYLEVMYAVSEVHPRHSRRDSTDHSLKIDASKKVSDLKPQLKWEVSNLPAEVHQSG